VETLQASSHMDMPRPPVVVPVLSRITGETINQNVKNASYAVRGPIVARSMEIMRELKTEKGKAAYPFQKVIACNIGNPHALGQKSLSFVRDVLSIALNPSLVEKLPFPLDAVKRAEKYLEEIHDAGVYTVSQGMLTVREEVSKFLENRDGYPSDPNSIFLTNGASEGVRFCMQTLLRDPREGFNDGVLTPIPQYPLYSALTVLLQAHQVPYYLDEEKDWGCSASFLTDALNDAQSKGICPRAVVVINPGNPTGQILPEETIKDIITWCRSNNICLMADEVYQENVWKKGSKFVSFRKVALDMNAFDGNDPLQMISFHSTSKGFMGECGLRGGYFEILGMPEVVKAEILKLASINLCSNTVGQITTGLMVNPPEVGELSHMTYVEERDNILASLKRRAALMSDALNDMEGVSSTTIDGSMYAFPTIKLPHKAIEAATKAHMQPDAMYCTELLENTGIVVVPGSGFGQKEGTYHFRITILPPEESMYEVIKLLKDFHSKFTQRYS